MEYPESLTARMYGPEKTLLGVDYAHIRPTRGVHSPQALGADEQAPGAMFVRLVDPTELDKAREEMIRLLKDQYTGVDWLNLDLWRKTDRGRLNDFLRRYMIAARTRMQSVSSGNIDAWITEFTAKYPDMRHEDLTDWFNVFLTARAAGQVSDIIYRPWTYEPQEPIDVFSKAVGAGMDVAGKGLSSGFNRVLIAGSAVAVLYLLGRRIL